MVTFSTVWRWVRISTNPGITDSSHCFRFKKNTKGRHDDTHLQPKHLRSRSRRIRSSKPALDTWNSVNEQREGGTEEKRKKGKKTAPIHTSSHVSKIHVLWLKSQEPGYYAKKACILESHQLESSGQVKPMCSPVMNDNLSPKGCSQGKYLWHLHSFSGLWSSGTLLGWDPWLHGYCREHSDYETMRRRKSPWQRLFLSLISTVNDTQAPVDSFMLINKFK